MEIFILTSFDLQIETATDFLYKTKKKRNSI